MNEIKNHICSEPYISSYTFRYYSDHGWLSSKDNNKYISCLPSGIDPCKVKEGDVVYVATEYLDIYLDRINPKITVPYTLITTRGDRGVTNKDVEKITDNIIHWYAVNNTSNHPRVTTVPLGLQNKHWRVYNHPQSDSNLIHSISKEDISVEKDVLVTFRIVTNAPERQKCYDYFKDKGFVTQRHFDERLRINTEFVSDYFREIKRHKFIVCPFGGGWDCHRNWETFSLGGIPIIKKHRSMEAFYDMPAWFVDDWNEVDTSTIDNKYNEIKQNWNMFNHDKKYFTYWKNLIWNSKNQR